MLLYLKRITILHTSITISVIRFPCNYACCPAVEPLNIYNYKIYLQNVEGRNLNASKEPFLYLLFVIFYFLYEAFQASYCRHHVQLEFSITGNLVLLFSAPSVSVTDDGA